MSKEKVLVTGGMGFIGTALAKRLLGSGFQVAVLDNLSPQIHGVIPSVDLAGIEGPDFTVHRGDVRNPRDFEPLLAEADYLVHLAAETGTAQSMYEISRYNAINSQGTAEILDWMMNHKHKIKKVVLSSSRSIYGEGAYRCATCGIVSPDSRSAEALAARQWEPVCPSCAASLELIPTPEGSRPCPASIYAATKLAQEDLIRIACGASGIPYTILRFQNVYGPGQSLNNPYTGILSIFSTRIRRGLPLSLFEDGQESRDFVHVTDIAQAIALSLTSPLASGHTLNVGAGIPTSVQQVAEMLVKVFRGSSAIGVTAQYRIGDIRHCYADLSETKRVIGFEPKVNLEEGLAGFAAWVQSQPLPEDQLDHANKMLIDRGLMK